MNDDGRDILNQMGLILKEITPKGAKSSEFLAHVFAAHTGQQLNYYDPSGKRVGPVGLAEFPDDAVQDLAALAAKMREAPIYRNDPYTHLRLVLTDGAKMDLTVLRIPEWDTWPGLFMRGVSELADSELTDAGVPEKDAKTLREQRKREPYTP